MLKEATLFAGYLNNGDAFTVRLKLFGDTHVVDDEYRLADVFVQEVGVSAFQNGLRDLSAIWHNYINENLLPSERSNAPRIHYTHGNVFIKDYDPDKSARLIARYYRKIGEFFFDHYRGLLDDDKVERLRNKLFGEDGICEVVEE